MKYLLINPPKKGIKGFIECPPVGLGYLATALRRSGRQEVDLQDCIINGWNNEETVDYIQETKPYLIGINLFSTGVASVKNMLELLTTKDHKPIVVLGGPHVTGTNVQTLEYFKEADFGIVGEGEIPIVELCEYLEGKRIAKYVHGLVYREQGTILYNEGLQHDYIDDFGFPAWDLIKPKRYFNVPIVGKNSCTIHFSRGCPFSCGFCVKFGTKVRWRDWRSIWREMQFLDETYGVKRFLIHDEGFTMFPVKVKEFCRLMIHKKAKYTFFSALGLRLNRVDDEMMQLMNKVGFEKSFGVGIESAVPRVRQELINKHLTQEELINGLTVLNRNGFTPVGNFILGYPGDTRLEIKQSIQWACEYYDKGLLHGANFVPFLPLPGSPIVKKMLETGELPKDFDFSNLNSQGVLYAPQGMTIKELDDLRRWAVWRFNFRWKMIRHFLRPDLFVRALISFIRIYAPNWILPKNWRRL